MAASIVRCAALVSLALMLLTSTGLTATARPASTRTAAKPATASAKPEEDFQKAPESAVDPIPFCTFASSADERHPMRICFPADGSLDSLNADELVFALLPEQAIVEPNLQAGDSTLKWGASSPLMGARPEPNNPFRISVKSL